MIEQQREAERKALQNAIDAGSVKALQDFIAQYPKSEFVSHAESCIVDFELWNKARQKDTKAAYQNYLDTSTVLGFKNEAESAIVRFETEEAWDECHNSNSIIKLESFMEKYPNSSHVREAEYEVNLLEAAKYYKQNSRSLSLSYYEKANAYRSLTGSHRKCYDELLQEATYERLMDSDDLDDMQRFLRQLSLDSPYYTPISNRIAIIKAQELTVNSTQEDMDGAMSYAMDDGTKSAVKRYISDIKKCQREKRRIARKDRRKAWWEDRATLGWSIVTADIDPMLNIELEDLYYGSLNSSNYPSTCSLSTGLRLRFGRYNDLLNFTIGADYQNYWGKYVTYSGYYLDIEDVNYMTIHRRLAFPVNLKLNMASGNSNKAFYFGCTAEFGYDINYIGNYFKNIHKFDDFLDWQATPSIAIEPQIGFNRKHFDWGIYYRWYIEGYRFFDANYSDGNKRIGLFMVVYF